jgi:hypothetical protein
MSLFIIGFILAMNVSLLCIGSDVLEIICKKSAKKAKYV